MVEAERHVRRHRQYPIRNVRAVALAELHVGRDSAYGRVSDALDHHLDALGQSALDQLAHGHQLAEHVAVPAIAHGRRPEGGAERERYTAGPEDFEELVKM